MNNAGYFLKNFFFEYFPVIALSIKFTLKVLLHPGFPIINIGIFKLIDTNNKNKLSLKGLFSAIPFSKSICDKINFSSDSRIEEN